MKTRIVIILIMFLQIGYSFAQETIPDRIFRQCYSCTDFDTQLYLIRLDTCVNLIDLLFADFNILPNDEFIIESEDYEPIKTTFENLDDIDNNACVPANIPISSLEIIPRRQNFNKEKIAYFCLENTNSDKVEPLSITGLYKNCEEKYYYISQDGIYEFEQINNIYSIRTGRFELQNDVLITTFSNRFIGLKSS